MNRKIKMKGVVTVLAVLIISGFMMQAEEVYPARFDLREEGRTTPVKWREYYSRTVEYSAYACMESVLTPGEYRGFYEKDLIPFLQQFDHYNYRPPNLQMVVAVLAAWAGPTDPPPTPPTYGYSYHHTGAADIVQKHLQQVIYLPGHRGPQNMETVKWFIMNHGPVYAEMTYYQLFYNGAAAAYYHFGHFGDPDEWPLASTAIVGWDDDFDRNNFVETPPGDGAFIAKNTLGPYYGDGGYFYISYYDSDLHVKACFTGVEPALNYGEMHHYDPLGATSYIGVADVPGAAWGANVFTARNDAPLEAVSFYTNDAGTVCDIHIYKHVGGAGPVTGALAARQTERFTFPGYYTVKLHTPVPLSAGERFSTVIKFSNPLQPSPVAIEAPVVDYSSQAAANPGESFISADGVQWRDLTVTHPGSNVCIKAFSTFIHPFPGHAVGIDARMVSQGLWLMDQEFVQITLTVDNIPQEAIASIDIYRKRDGDIYQRQRSVGPSGLVDGSYTYYDHNVSAGNAYTYHGVIYTTDERIAPKSVEQTVKFE